MRSQLIWGIGFLLLGGCKMTFSGLTEHGAPVSTYTEGNLTLTTTSADWQALTNFGASTISAIVFYSAGGVTTDGEVTLTARGKHFSFNQVDLYSSTTAIPYVFEGKLDGKTVFSTGDTQGSTFGNFVTVHNPRSTDEIDTLIIRLSNSAAPCCRNPMGLDNIVLRPLE